MGGETVKLTKAQFWLLRYKTMPMGWGKPGGPDPTKAIQKDIVILVRKGALEADAYGLYRITPAGRAALKEAENA